MAVARSGRMLVTETQAVHYEKQLFSLEDVSTYSQIN